MKNVFKISLKYGVLSMLLVFVSALIGGPVLLADAVIATPNPNTAPGAAGVQGTQVPGPTTVSNAEANDGGIGGDNLIQPDIDDQIFQIATDETVLDGLMRKAKRKVNVKAWEVDHYVLDERKASTTTTSQCGGAGQKTAVVPVQSSDQDFCAECGTLLAKGVNGYDPTGQTELPGVDLMLYISDRDSSTGNPICRAINGPKSNATDEFCNVPTIASGTELIFLANALAETQKEVAPNIVLPQPTRVYLQKSALNQIVSDYFDAQKKRIPFAQATIAEAAVKQFRKEVNRTLWIGHKSKFYVNRGKMGNQLVYTTEGIRWQFTRTWYHSGDWTFDEIISLFKDKFTGQACSKEAVWLMGKDQLEGIQLIDFTKHKDITMTSAEKWGFACTQLHTVFGDAYLIHEPTLDYIGYAKSGGLIDLSALVRYTLKNEEASTEQIEGEEAVRKAIISINALALKGTSHIWVDGDFIAENPMALNKSTASIAAGANTTATLSNAIGECSISVSGEVADKITATLSGSTLTVAVAAGATTGKTATVTLTDQTHGTPQSVSLAVTVAAS